MNTLYIGAGFVGACSAAVAADSGNTALVYDIDTNKIELLGSGDRDKIETCLYEKGLGDLLVRNTDRVQFTTDYSVVQTALDTVDAIFMCLPTPEIGETGESNLTYYNTALASLAAALKERNGGAQEKYIVLVNKSTVPIETAENTKQFLAEQGVLHVGVVANPEFLVEGKAIDGALTPDRVVVGASSQRDFGVMRKVYQRFFDSPTVKYIEVNPKEAAAGKLLANFYLFNKLAVCFDIIGRTSETFEDVSFEHLRSILMADKRIGNWGFFDSLYAGGSCLIKDSRSLSYQLQSAGQDVTLVTETYLANKRQLTSFLARAQAEAQFDFAGKTVALIGTAFKRDTNDIRNSASIEIMHFLQEQNVAQVKVYDPEAMPMFASQFSASNTLTYASHEYEAMKQADVVIIASDWPQFRGIADVLISEAARPLIMDGRRMLQHRYADLVQTGFDVIAVGSPFLSQNTN